MSSGVASQPALADMPRVVRRSNFPAPDFTSTDQTVAFDTLLTVAHGLGSVPPLWTVMLKCTTADLNYAVGDEVDVDSIPGDPTAAATDDGVVTLADATDITIVQGEAIGLHDKTGFNVADITVGSWRWVVRAWR